MIISPSDGTVTLQDGKMSATISVNIVDDTVSELDEDLQIVLTSVTGAVKHYHT